jgi:hypothetical protein
VNLLHDKIRRIPRRYWLYYLPLIAAVVGFALFLEDAPLPWEKGVEAREAAGKVVKSEHLAITGLWWGAWFALGVLGVLAIAGPIALRKLSPSFERIDAGLGKRSTPAFWIFATITVAIAAIEMAPRLNSSLWGDEDYTLRRSIVGQWERNQDGELWFRELTWNDTLFAYRTPNNHVFYSILARLSHGPRIESDDPGQRHFDETRIRMPAFLLGLAAIPALGYLLSVIGYRRAGIAAMFLLALHPFYIRHAPEARGYPLTMFFAPLALAFLIKAVRRGRAVYWAGYALCQALLFYTYPGTIYFLVAINIAALWQIWTARRGRDRITMGARWFAACTGAALPIVFLMTPLAPQMRDYMNRSRAQGELHVDWVKENLAQMATGIPWYHADPDNPLQLALEDSTLVSALLLIAFYTLVLAGLWRLWRTRHRWLVFALLAPYLLMLAHAWASNTLLYQWYSVPLLPCIVALAALGIEFTTARIANVKHRTMAGFAVLIIALILYIPPTRAQVHILQHHSVEPLGESVALTREVINPTHPDIGEAITVQFCQAARSYDPTTHFYKPEKKEPDAPDKLFALMALADAEGKPLHVNLGMPALARLEWPGLMEIVDDRHYFEPHPDSPLFGLQEPCTRYIYRYRRNSYQSDRAPSPDGS